MLTDEYLQNECDEIWTRKIAWQSPILPVGLLAFLQSIADSKAKQSRAGQQNGGKAQLTVPLSTVCGRFEVMVKRGCCPEDKLREPRRCRFARPQVRKVCPVMTVKATLCSPFLQAATPSTAFFPWSSRSPVQLRQRAGWVALSDAR